MGGLLRVWKRIPPFIAVPTTAGTGSETTIAALITDTDTRHKYAIMDLHLIPLYAVLDPELTENLPPPITAATGMDALTHAVEGYLCWTYSTKESAQSGLDAVKIIFANLENAYKNGHDLEARQAMMLASYKAGWCFTRAGVGNVHAIAHTLGGLYNTAHGLANAVILPIVLEDYGPKVYPKLAVLADAAGIGQACNAIPEKARAFIAEVRAMNRRMGSPTGFDFIKAEDIPKMVKWADAEANPLYPVPVFYTKEHYREVIDKIRTNKRRPAIDEKECSACRICVTDCPAGCLRISDPKAPGDIAVHAELASPDTCTGCGLCEKRCPLHAIEMRI
jgi:alcohol dehydrogenase class IV